MTAAARASDRQAEASNPQGSAWVSANAGSGKTHVLVNRVVRLLLTGTPPERILCLTYTKAAAAEMSDRLFKELADWLALGRGELTERIHRHTGHATFKDEDHAVARRLFTRALETPGGLKVQTIHAFCEKLLQRFPVEAGVVPGFEVMDDMAARDLRLAASEDVLARAKTEPASLVAQQLSMLAAQTQHGNLDALIRQLIDKRREVKPLIADQHARARTEAALSTVLGTSPDDSEQTLISSLVQALNATAYRNSAAALATRSAKTDQAQAALIEQLLQADDAGEQFSILQSLFLKADGNPKSDSSVLTKTATRDVPAVAEFLFCERDRVDTCARQLRALRVYQATCALLGIGGAILETYEQEKRTRGLYDYDDLILRTLDLLREGGASAWVLYKLDGGLDHILIDEAQDTSPEQWKIIERLTEEFFSGGGAREDIERTVFAVGDRKQSIYSFQGADPAGFDAMRRHFAHQTEMAGQTLSEVPLQVSFRSTPQVLSLVDEVFSQPAAAAGVSLPGQPAEVHSPTRSGQAGLVELWPVEQPAQHDARDIWQAPRAEDDVQHQRISLAVRIAGTIRNWIDAQEQLTAHARPIRYCDILILVRNRTTFADTLVRALKQRGVPVAGADRLKLTRHIAVQDLLSLARFVTLAEDDLTLAEVLKSPLVARDDGIPFDDDDLFTIAHDRGKLSLWASLNGAVDDGAPYAQALERLDQWRRRAGFSTPYDFFSSVLTADDTRAAFLTRLGSEAAEPIDAFLNEALAYEQRHVADLRGFAAWIEGSDPEIKRDMDHSGDEVRVMTVHGAKGLEANVVILPDTDNVPNNRKVPEILFAGDVSLPVWQLRKSQRVDATSALAARYLERLQEEENRLLYVAMTRARDRLYVCGYAGRNGVGEKSWYQLVANVLQRDEWAVTGPDDEVICWRREDQQDRSPEESEAAAVPETAGTENLPDWAVPQRVAGEPVAHQATASHLLVPASISDLPAETFLSPMAEQDVARFKRGTLIHRLLQILPDLPAGRHQSVAEAYLRQPAHALSGQEADEISREVLNLIAMPDFAAVFGSDSRAEVALTAHLDTAQGPVTLTGQIDRLAVTDQQVLIVDFKTNRPAPAHIDEADPAYVRQLAAYRHALSAIYPARQVRAALLWTHTASFMEVPAELLDDALAAFGPVK